jgi:hypothetical protein
MARILITTRNRLNQKDEHISQQGPIDPHFNELLRSSEKHLRSPRVISQLTLSGDITSVRFSFAFFDVNE